MLLELTKDLYPLFSCCEVGIKSCHGELYNWIKHKVHGGKSRTIKIRSESQKTVTRVGMTKELVSCAIVGVAKKVSM